MKLIKLQMKKIVEKYVEMPRSIRRPMWQIWHKIIIKFDKKGGAIFMNYGYQSLNGDIPVKLDEEDEINRYCIQLYDHVVNKVDLKGKNVLEVGSGRGGGASFIKRYYMPETYTAMDISSAAIDFCSNYHKVPGLSFVKGYAEEQPFEDQSFDAVVNVESARCYGDISKFFSEVYRVLKPDGYFLLADMIKKDELDPFINDLKKNGFKILHQTKITPSVVKALDNDSARREESIKSQIPKFLVRGFLQFAGTKGTERYNSFATERIEYWSFVLSKN